MIGKKRRDRSPFFLRDVLGHLFAPHASFGEAVKKSGALRYPIGMVDVIVADGEANARHGDGKENGIKHGKSLHESGWLGRPPPRLERLSY